AEAAAAEALQAAEEAAAAGRRALEEEASTERTRATDLERELEATREALGTYATDTIERIEAAERTAREAQGYRDRYARKLAAAMEQVRVLRAEAESEARAQCEALQGLGGMVGQMTARTVLQAARDLAARAGRESPEAEDVDAAIAAMTDAVPAEVADELWAQRDAFMDASYVE
ncbi:MAG: hypothetical protein Q8S73_03165, partial [Deltaproteobacteria bacterium]|nr:hypothetical protein [Deltaproteobacteria bacterium]